MGVTTPFWMYHGSEFTSLAMLRWSAERKVQVHFNDPGKPTQNAKIESLNGKIRDELLNMHTFTTIFEARRAAAEFRDDYNEVRPHSALGMLTPREFAERNQNNPPSQLPQVRIRPYTSPRERRCGLIARERAIAPAQSGGIDWHY
jgi:transposase InsO family protein